MPPEPSTESPPRGLPLVAAARRGPGLAASWYIALPSGGLGRRPRALDLFGEELVAWRDGQGRAVIMPRHCPHQGASLALGKVVDGCLRCPFHHWRFDGEGQCVEIPGLDRVPVVARHTTYPVIERYGYVWAWYGSPTPMFPLPEFPALEARRGDYLAYRFSDETTGSPRKILENAYDYYHFSTLHRVRSAEPLQLTLLTDPEAARDNGPPIAAEAWSGARLDSPELVLPWVSRLFGMAGTRFSLLIDGWPGGQRLTFYVDGREIVKELLGVTPVGPNRSIQQGWTLVRKAESRWKSALYYMLYYVQHRAGTKQDLAMYDGAASDRTGVYVKYDRGVVKFREHYQRWVDRVIR